MDSLRGEKALFSAWLVALVASLSVLFIGEVLGQTPCSLCWFQRAFMFPLAILLGLGLGLWWRDLAVGRYGAVLALAGAAIALWHLALYIGLIPERIQPCAASGPSCTDFNQLLLGVPIPALALLSFLAIAALCALSRKGAPA
ncbi:disulfide bond formation protein B [Pseudosulfitobacter koreensis]|uniref:Disulfide bond formation protein B n=1 Tax=Pseudosulfitobacter koreensis TaxID=2968472 RepID=A0ABT1YWK0_9RHOB|nr:disulfide bond formation protein B [Pseudosulfitobacter koreense]MCR8825263.1 disulfide bond formation protein B [Pseudosulfitobacter koreense]